MLTTIVLDPGHGGIQRRGNSTPDGVRLDNGQLEKQVNYALAQRVAYHLGGAHLTRGEQENCSLGERIEFARHRGAEAFVSLHTSGGVGGGATYGCTHAAVRSPSSSPRGSGLTSCRSSAVGPPRSLAATSRF